MSGRSSAQVSRQRQDYRDKGKYSRVNPCYRCGKSAGIDYCSFLGDDTDACGNHWYDVALCVCEKCWIYLDELTPEAAWAETSSPNWGKFQQGKGD